MYHIYAMIANQIVVFVGCSRSSVIPTDAILLQTVEHHPEVHWIKWSVRFRRTLTNQKALSHPYARYFRNSARANRLFGADSGYARFEAEQNAAFLRFHERNPHVLDELVQAALAKQTEGRTEYSMDQLLGDMRWGDTEIDRADDRVKINARWSAWYSRVVQIVEPRLIGFFAVRSGTPDGLVWEGKTWRQFAAEHEDEINWNDPFDELPDGDWEYKP